MAQLDIALDKLLDLEGGYVLHEVEGDTGGQTYAGISRNNWPGWLGWGQLDAWAAAFFGTVPIPMDVIQPLVEDFYKDNFWNQIHGDEIESQAVATSIFTFAVNAGARWAIRLAQRATGASDDGVVGPLTLGCINGMGAEDFGLRYFKTKVQRYADICNADKSRVQAKTFLLGWINRVLNE
jgi:lysozyme family protein